MKKELMFLTIVLSVLMTFSLVSSLENKTIRTEIEITYSPEGNCTTTCENVTVGNTTEEQCTNYCSAQLEVKGEKLLQIYELGNESINDILQNNVEKKMGDMWDATVLAEEIRKNRQYEINYNACLDSNRNISARLSNFQEDIQYKANFTECDSEREDLQESLNECSSERKQLEEDLDNAESSRLLWGLGGIIACFLFIKYGLPKIKGEGTPKEDTQELPPNPGYD